MPLRDKIAAGAEALRKAREDNDALVDELATHERVIIAGGPRTGKSTLAVRAGERHGHQVRHGDSLVGTHEWSEASAEVAKWFDESGRWIVEGVSAPRAIRKWLKANPGKPVDATIVWCPSKVQVRGKPQDSMAKAVETVWREILPELKRRGAKVIERGKR